MDTRKAMNRLSEMFLLVDQAYLKIAQHNDLSYNALMILYMLEEDNTLTQKDICAALQLPKSTTHSTVLDMMKRELVTLTEGNNRKEKFLTLTPKGTVLLKKVLAETVRIEDAAMRSVDEAAFLQFLQTAQVLASALVTQAEREYAAKEGAAHGA